MPNARASHSIGHRNNASGSMIMDDDPDDLAAAFFAQQAAKEAQKTALPTKDWIRVIQETTNNSAEVDAEKWLVTTLPDAQVGSHNSKGIEGIILNSDSCKLVKKNETVKKVDKCDKEIRDKIKQLMLEKIKSDLDE